VWVDLMIAFHRPSPPAEDKTEKVHELLMNRRILLSLLFACHRNPL
jgi:hypothetical protein